MAFIMFRVIVLENLIFSRVQCCCVIYVADLTPCDKVFVVVCFAMFSGAAVKLCLGDLLVMGLNPETASLHM